MSEVNEQEKITIERCVKCRRSFIGADIIDTCGTCIKADIKKIKESQASV